jgi:hypothetical protein
MSGLSQFSSTKSSRSLKPDMWLIFFMGVLTISQVQTGETDECKFGFYSLPSPLFRLTNKFYSHKKYSGLIFMAPWMFFGAIVR